MLVFELGYGSNHFGFLRKEILVFYSTLETNVVNDKDFLVSCDSAVKPRREAPRVRIVCGTLVLSTRVNMIHEKPSINKPKPESETSLTRQTMPR